MTAETWKPGDRFEILETTIGWESLEIVKGWRVGARRYVVAAHPETARAIREGAVDWEVAHLSGAGGKVRRLPREYFFRLVAEGRVRKTS